MLVHALAYWNPDGKIMKRRLIRVGFPLELHHAIEWDTPFHVYQPALRLLEDMSKYVFFVRCDKVREFHGNAHLLTSEHARQAATTSQADPEAAFSSPLFQGFDRFTCLGIDTSRFPANVFKASVGTKLLAPGLGHRQNVGH
ncbi:hypothetical protein S40293_11220 [Stachybotrys chartarum IBT 40293]|nr:hypothetical protein S40293_11220 [Stachybotrys chartarum IBT 40293]